MSLVEPSKHNPGEEANAPMQDSASDTDQQETDVSSADGARARRIAEVEAQIRDGTYSVDALDVSKKIVEKHFIAP